MRLSIRTKMFFLVTFVLLGSVLAVLAKTRTIFFEDKYDFIRQLSSKLSASSGKLAQEKLIEFQNRIATVVSNRESLKKIKTGKELNTVLFERNPEFLAVSVQRPGVKNWDTDWTQINTEHANAWTDSYTETILRSINYTTLASGALQVNRVADAKGNAYFVLSFLADLKDEKQTAGKLSSIVAILDAHFLADIVREYKGDLNTVFIVDNRGYVVSHPQENMIGSERSSHPVVKAITSGRESGSGQFEMDDGETVIANFNSIPGTNLYMIITTPEKQAFLAARDLIITVITFGLGFLIIGSVLAFLISSRITKPLNELIEIAEVIGSGDFKTQVNVQSSDEVGDLAKSIDKMKISLLERDEKIEHSKMALVQSEKMSAFGQLSAGIAHEVKNPLAGILGHAQLAKSKAKDPDVAKHLDMIEKETRRTKEIIENLMKFARAEKPELTSTDLQETVSRAVDLVDHQVSLQGVKIIKDLHPVSLANANSNQIQQVLLNLMMNASHAMETAKTKELKVSVEDKGENVQIRIRDTGSGMTPEVQKRIFEPFFTTKPAGKGTGLGLSVSIGIVQDHKGKIYVESEVGKGTTFFIDIPKLGSSSAASLNTLKPVAETTKLNELTVKKPIEKNTSPFPEFSAPKQEAVLDKEVQRDYLKAAAQAPKENVRSLDEIRKEAQDILKKEKDLLKKEESKLSDALKLQQQEASKLGANLETVHKSNFPFDEVRSTKIEPPPHQKVDVPKQEASTVLSSVESALSSDSVKAGSDAHTQNVTELKPKDLKTGEFKVNIRKPKLKV